MKSEKIRKQEFKIHFITYPFFLASALTILVALMS